MATWRPNEAAYGPGGGEYVDDAGSIWPDPFGTLNQPPAAAPNTGEIMNGPGGGSGGFELPPGFDASASPENTTPAPMAPATTTSGQLNANLAAGRSAFSPPDNAVTLGADGLPIIGSPGAAGAPPVPTPGFADKHAVAGGPASPPPPQPGLADQAAGGATPPAFVQVTDTKDSTTGLSPADRARTEQGVGRQQDAQARADEGDVRVQQLAADQAKAQALQKLQSASNGIADAAAKLAVQDHIATEVDRRLNAGGPNSKDQAGLGSAYWRPDRAELFHGDHGVMFGLAAAVAAMAGAWMQGRGLTQQNPYLPTIMKMIDDNVDQQVRQNSTAFQHLKDIKGDVRAAKLELKERQLSYVQQQADGLALRDKSEILQAGVSGLRDKLTAEREKTRNDQEKALNQSVTHETNRKMMANPAAKAAPNKFPARLAARRANDSQFIHEWTGLRAQLKGAEQSGAAAGYIGTIATHGVNWVQEHLNGLPPEQQQVAMMMARLEELNHLHTGASMVGLSSEEKERFGKVGVPQKARDLSNTYSYFDQLSREKREQIKGNYGADGADGTDDGGGDDLIPEGSF